MRSDQECNQQPFSAQEDTPTNQVTPARARGTFIEGTSTLTGENYTRGSSPTPEVPSPLSTPLCSLTETWSKKGEKVCAPKEHAIVQSTLIPQNEI